MVKDASGLYTDSIRPLYPTSMEGDSPLPAELLSLMASCLLVCPACRHPLAPAPVSLRCTGCGNEYPIVDGIPVLLTERASKTAPPAG